jgi:N-acetylglucosamine malate deacetylase 1
MSPDKPIDIVVFGPHPDDAELGAGGFLLKMNARGYRTAIVDLTQGETGTKGTPQIRGREAQAAAKKLLLSERIGLDLGDGQLADSWENRTEVISVLRILKPRLVVAPWEGDEHPDHRAAGQLVRSAYFLARLPKIETGNEFHAAQMLWAYGIHHEAPDCIAVDISDFFEQKLEVLNCYESQFVNPKLPQGYRYGGTADYLLHSETRARLWGEKIGRPYAEAFKPLVTLRVDDPFGDDTEEE